MLDVDDLYLRLGEAPLFDGVTFRIVEGQRIALAGRNGQGKSTLMRAILGETQIERGRIGLAKGRTLGYLPQDITPVEGPKTVIEETLTALPQLAALEEEVLALTEALAKAPENQDLLAKYGRAQAQFEALDGYGIDARARSILDGLGFTQERMAGPVTNLSGGWLMRVYLAKLLLRQPDLLLLDEPTNHLDLESREWLLEFLKGFSGSVLLVSHDRYFLDQLVTKVFELESGALTVYSGNYSEYERQRAERILHLKLAFARQQRELKRQQTFIEKNRAKAATASNVQSRIKQLAKVEKIELPPEPPDIKLRFPTPPPAGQVAFRLERVAKSYGVHVVFSDLDLELPSGEKLAVVGVNGAGKTTLLKLLSDRAEPSGGKLTLGHNILVQYFSQYEDMLPDSNYSMLQAMEEAAPPDCAVSRRSILGCFLFSDEAVHKPIKVLSGGEKARLKMARMLLKPSNVLILDEPTNHLDLHSKDILLSAIKAFPGTVVFVSHDRQFLAALATSVLEVKDGRGTFYPCDYEQYRWRLARDQREAAAAAAKRAKADAPAKLSKGDASSRPQPKSATKAQSKQARVAERRAAKDQQRRRKKLEQKVERLQAEIEEAEAKVTALEATMSEPGFFDDSERSQPIVQEHKLEQVAVEQGYQALGDALDALEALEAPKT